MAGKYYAVRAGRIPGIYTSWEECKVQIDGYKSASYKSFKTAGEAAEFMNLGKITTDSIGEKDTAVAYVDGSFNIATKVCGYGVVFFFNDEEIHLKGGFEDEALANMRNVAGEIKGSQAAMEYALSQNIPKLKIYHDYEGIAKWCTGEWKANKEGTIAYKEFFNSISGKIKIEFVKVKGHSGDKYNDVADQLAKEACGVV